MTKIPKYLHDSLRDQKVEKKIGAEDKLLKEILLKLEFKPRDTFSVRELMDKARIFYKNVTKEGLGCKMKRICRNCYGPD
jgi:hypothetical protein